MGNGFEVIVEDEDDTLGNIVQSYLTRMFADYSLPPEERKLVAITYHKTHPLKRQIRFLIKQKLFLKMIRSIIFLEVCPNSSFYIALLQM